MDIRVRGIATHEVEHIRAGGPDAHGKRALVRIAEGGANPCRHCLGLIANGDEKLVLAHRPFPKPQPYAEVGPIFLHPHACPAYDRTELPPWFAFMEPAIVRGYDMDDWILYETGCVVPGREIGNASRSILAYQKVDYVHVRSKFNCYQCRIERA